MSEEQENNCLRHESFVELLWILNKVVFVRLKYYTCSVKNYFGFLNLFFKILRKKCDSNPISISFKVFGGN